jgi:ESCRT-I complex subunit TSG101
MASPTQQPQVPAVPPKPGRPVSVYLPETVTPASPVQHLANPAFHSVIYEQQQMPRFASVQAGYQQARPFQSVPPQQPQYHPSPQTAPPPGPVSAPQQETPDLLTSPFELELPSIVSSGPAPPVPPNPQKDALLRTLSRALTERLQANVSQSRSAVFPLQSQSQALQAAMATLQGEIAALNNFQTTLQSNITVLQQSLHRADAVIADAQARSQLSSSSSTQPGPSTATPTTTGLPPVDDVLVAPTIVGKQLYDLIAEERSIQRAIYALQAALVKNIIGVDTWSRHTRGLAREAYMKRALIRKIGRGMKLEDPDDHHHHDHNRDVYM